MWAVSKNKENLTTQLSVDIASLVYKEQNPYIRGIIVADIHGYIPTLSNNDGAGNNVKVGQ